MTLAQHGAFGHAPRDTGPLLTLIRASRLTRGLTDSFLILYGLLDTNTVKLLAH